MKRVSSILNKMVIVWTLVSLIPAAYYFYMSAKSHTFLLARMEAQGLQFLSHVDVKATQLHDHLDQTVRELSRSKLIHDFAKSPTEQRRQYLESQWLLNAVNSTYFYQLRYIDTRGMEVIRVEYDALNKRALVVPPSQLQNKSQRDYFRYAQQLTGGEQGYFGIDIEFEHGKPVIPYKPGFRILYPIEDNGTRLGYFVANLHVLEIIAAITDNQQNMNVHFVDDQGYFTLSSDSQLLFGDIIRARAGDNIPNHNPELWEHMQAHLNQEGSVMTLQGLYVYRPFNQQIFANVNSLTMLAYYPPSVVDALFLPMQQDIISETFILWLFLGLVAAIIAMHWDDRQRIKTNRTFAQLAIENGGAVALTDSEHYILRANAQLNELVGLHSASEVLKGHNLLDYQPTQAARRQLAKQLELDGRWKGQLTLLSQDNTPTICEAEVRALPGKFTKVDYFIYSFTDISQHHMKIAELTEQTERDPATSLWNKRKFDDHLRYQARLHQRYPDHPPGCLAIIDIDEFKQVNDSQGHAFGDEVITYVASQLTALLRDTDMVARIGGDEFAVIIQHIELDQAFKLMQRVSEAITQGASYPITLSIGLARLCEDASATFSRADGALYRSKNTGRNQVSADHFPHFTVVEN